MANIKVNNYHNLKLRINRDEYWDFFVNKDADTCGEFKYDQCLISDIDMCSDECKDGESWLFSKSGYTWENAVAVEHTLHNISYVGVDNGLFTYRKDRITNKEFVDLFTTNKYKIDEGDYRLKLHAVSGNTLEYEYPLHMDDCEVRLNGGFFQGFFKTECDKYQVLPSKFFPGDTYTISFELNRCDLEKESDKTLNDKYPNNKGIFFYIGTRAENKWIYLYDKDDKYGAGDCFQLDVSDFVEDGEIDEKDYVIGYFGDPNPDFEAEDPFQLGDYTDYTYYDESYYDDDYCDFEDLSYYVEVEYRKKAKLIDYSLPHGTLESCCGYSDEADNFVLRPFFNGCGCPVRYKRERASSDSKTSESGILAYDAEFGEEYVAGLDEEFGDISDCTDYLEGELDISDFEYYTDNGFNFAEANQYYFYTDNKFMMFDRTKDGKTTRNWIEGTEYMYYGRKSKFDGNLFILMNRTKTGYTVHDIDTVRNENANDYDVYSDLYNNALAFRITDDGEIGYRMLTIDCSKEGRDKTSVIEGYSFKDVIPSCEWVKVDVRMMFLPSAMKLMFYVNGKLKYVTKDLPSLNLKELADLYEKQEGVPYNISIGGGTQGLSDTVQYNYMLPPSRVYPLEKAFAGSFIGYMRGFSIRNCMLEKKALEMLYERMVADRG